MIFICFKTGCNWVGPQTHLVPWIFWSPRNLVPEKFGPQKFGPCTFLVPKKFGPQDIWSPRNLVPGKFGPQEIWSPRNVVPRKFGPQEIWSPGNLVPKKNGPPKNLPNIKEIKLEWSFLNICTSGWVKVIESKHRANWNIFLRLDATSLQKRWLAFDFKLKKN